MSVIPPHNILCTLQRDMIILGREFPEGTTLIQEIADGGKITYYFKSRAVNSNLSVIDLSHHNSITGDNATIYTLKEDIEIANFGHAGLRYISFPEKKSATLVDPAINHPYIKSMQSVIEQKKYLLECLQKRMVLIRSGYELKSAHEKNEIEITRLETEKEISGLSGEIKRREEYFVKYFQLFLVEMEETERNMPELIQKVQSCRENKEVDKLLSSADCAELDHDCQKRISFYKQLKNLVA